MEYYSDEKIENENRRFVEAVGKHIGAAGFPGALSRLSTAIEPAAFKAIADEINRGGDRGDIAQAVACIIGNLVLRVMGFCVDDNTSRDELASLSAFMLSRATSVVGLGIEKHQSGKYRKIFADESGRA